ncbi:MULTISPECIES: zinc-binding dehydrogenase [Virgibacillus]|uniref:Alcohol dehydrogenase n=1 Tax=Virgibacillus massiliensis TaxID=1462526 RepID=A0A024QCR9_9BACI|nr:MULTISPECIES: zinc-binding dehydrogenase [Virgibacillus]CDQ40304.1 Alcohol dehydrogenase [Virgibacillus massiliensis]
MKAFVHGNGILEVKDMNEPTPNENEVVVSLKMAGLNRRDLAIPGRRKGATEDLILGSDGAGIIESVGENVDNVQVGEEVIINPALRWEDNRDAPPERFDILGMPDHGTFAEKISIDKRQVEKKPEHLSWDEAGVLALSGLTAFRALFTKGQIKAGETVFIPGAGSGVSTFLVAFAKNIGAKVIVSSRSHEKLEQARTLGADIGLHNDADWNESLADETVDLVIDSVGQATFNRSLKLLKKGGRMVIFGATTDDIVDINLREFFYGQYQLLGSTMGSRQEFVAMLDHIRQFKVHPVVDTTFTLQHIQEAFDYLQVNRQFGKVAIKLN